MKESFDIGLVQRAMCLAIEAHRDQKYGDIPYIAHLLEVYENARAADPEDSDLAAAAWLHDALEDTKLTLQDITACCGNEVAQMVGAVTDGPGVNRRERKELPYSLIPRVKGARLLKLCDRLANVRNCIRTKNEKLLSMYRREHEEFRTRLIRDYDLTRDERQLWHCLCEEIGGRR